MAKKNKIQDPPAAPVRAPRGNRPVQIGCPACAASGHVDEDKDGPFCPDCKGAGRITAPSEGAKTCERCEGEGEHKGMPCRPCASTGFVAGDAKAGELAEARAAAEAEAAEAKRKAELGEAFEKGRQSAFQEMQASKEQPA